MTGWRLAHYRSCNFGLGVLYEPRHFADLVKFTIQLGPWQFVLLKQWPSDC